MAKLVISGVIDGPLSGGLPKAVELTVLEDIADLSVFGLGSANNGGGSDGEEFTFPADSAAAGDRIYVASEAPQFTAFFGFAPDYTSSALGVNGDDAVELFESSAVIDVFGDINTDGSGQPWEYADGWAYRKDGTGPDGSSFDADNWTFSGTDALDGQSTNTSFPTATYTGPVPQPLVINEFVGSTTGSDVEFIELYGAPGASLAGLSLIVVESDDGAENGTIDKQFDFDPADVVGDNGYFLVGNDLVVGQFGVTPNAEIAQNFIENSSYTLALVETATITGGTVSGTETVIDAFGVTDGETSNFFALGAPVYGPDGSFLPAGLARTTPGGDTIAFADFNHTANTPTAGTSDDPVDPSIYTDLKIHEVQGDGAASPYDDVLVSVTGVVTASFTGTLNGFFLQEEDADHDADAATSEGIFIFTSDAPALMEGYTVTVTGMVSEFFDETQISADSVTIDSTDTVAGLGSISAALVDLPAVPTADIDGFYEAFEGMLVQFPDTLTVTQLFNYERYGEIHLSEGGRVTQYTQTNAPDVDGNAAYQEEQLARRIILDDGSSDQNPDTIPFFDQDSFSAGDTIDNLTGVLDYSFGTFRVQQTEANPVVFDDTNPREAAPQDVGGSLKVASFNVLNYFTTLDTPANAGAVNGNDPRGANSTAELDRQASKIVAALDEMDADVVGLIEIENDDDTAMNDLVARLNAVSDRTYAAVATGVIGGDAIKVGFIYDTDTVKIADGTTVAVLDTEAFMGPVSTVLDPNDVLAFDPKNRPAVAVTFEEIATGETFTAVNNHFKSKGSDVDGEDTNLLTGSDLGTIDGVQPVIGVDDGQGNGSASRESAADQLVDWLATNPTGSADADVLILGDLNAYAAETAIAQITEGADDTDGTADDFTDLAGAFIGDDSYSIRFSGQWGTLDYALANDPLLAQVTGVTEWQINSDEPAFRDYNDAVQDDVERSFEAKPTELDNQVDDTSPYRSSDHDPVIVGLNLGDTPSTLELVSSGDVSEDSVVLLARSSAAGDVTFEVYSVAAGGARTLVDTLTATNAGSNVPAKVAVSGLSDGVDYVFVATDAEGNTLEGEFTTAHADGQNGLSFGITGDWRGELSPFPAVANADDADLDFFILGGDTIYADYPVGTQAQTVDEFRAKYEEVYGENGGENFFADLLATTPIFATIDDHEVTNDFAGGATIGATAEDEFRTLFPGDDENALINDSTLFDNGLQAWHDHHAIAEEFYGETGDDLTANERKLYRSQEFGDDAAVMVLDQRSFRDEQITSILGSTDPTEIFAFNAASFDETRTMLGDAQLADLKADLLAAEEGGVTWKFVFTPEPMQDLGLGNGDSWEGYKAERTEILSFINDNEIDNVVFVAADIHATFVNNLTYSEVPLGPQIATSAFEITTGSVAFDAPFGPSAVAVAEAVGALTLEELAFYNSLPVAPDGDGLLNDKDDFVTSVFNGTTLDPLGLDNLGLDDNLPQADGLIDATLTQGGWVSAHTYGWTEFDIDAKTQALTVTTYGIDGYTEAQVQADPEAIAQISPRIVSQFTVNPELEPEVFTLELLHIADQEGTSSSIINAPNLSAVMNALEAQDLGNDGVADNTLRLSSGDAIIPGVFYDASEDAFGAGGVADILIQNELGLQAIALGNHEFDKGTEELAGLISGSVTATDQDGAAFGGTLFPYLSTNLDVSTDSNLAPLEVAGGQAPQGGTVTSSTVLDVNGEQVGVVGATTPTLSFISSPGDVTVSPAPFGANPTDAELDALAAEIQAEVDDLLANTPGLNKVILLSHMQRIEIEQALAERLENVDIIVAGGSNTRLFDDNDRPRDGDSDQGQYPIFIDNAGGTKTAVVNTDGTYKYVGRLVLDFDADGNILADSYDDTVSGAYATDQQGLDDLSANALIDPEIQAIADAIEGAIVAKEGNVFGVSNVFLNGNRSGTFASDDPDGVRTQETNLGNLTADANLAAAQAVDNTVTVSIKNGGGIRANIGETIVPAGGTEAVRSPNAELRDGDGNIVKPAGGISQNDIAATLAFNNGLTLLTLTSAELKATLENGVDSLPGVSGGFLQVAGVRFAFDERRDPGDRVVQAALVDGDGNDTAVFVQDGQLVGDPTTAVRIVTLNFLADGGDQTFSNLASPNRVDLVDLDGDGNDDEIFTGVATFAEDGSEQDALAEYLAANHADAATAFDEAETGPGADARILNLSQPNVMDASLAGTQIMRAGGFADLILGGIGDDILGGGRGIDTVDYEASGVSGIEARLHKGIVFGDGFRDKLFSIEKFVATDDDDTLVGGATTLEIFGGDGNDTIRMAAQANTILHGGAGLDTIIGGLGGETVFAGDDMDTVRSREGDDTVHLGAGDDIARLGAGDDRAFGDADNDLIFGGGGNDDIDGGIGNDTLFGNRNADALFGNIGDDELRGGNGGDTLDGGAGDDILFGGDNVLGDGSVDTFVFASTDNGQDIVKDFEDNKDVLDLSALGFVDFAALLAQTTEAGGTDLRIALNGGDQVVIENFLLSQFDAGDVMLS